MTAVGDIDRSDRCTQKELALTCPTSPLLVLPWPAPMVVPARMFVPGLETG
jgi:hypothetical protein